MSHVINEHPLVFDCYLRNNYKEKLELVKVLQLRVKTQLKK